LGQQLHAAPGKCHAVTQPGLLQITRAHLLRQQKDRILRGARYRNSHDLIIYRQDFYVNDYHYHFAEKRGLTTAHKQQKKQRWPLRSFRCLWEAYDSCGRSLGTSSKMAPVSKASINRSSHR
jgi:hypothetical protein